MGSFETPIGMRSSAMVETSCGYLLQELQMIWDEVGEEERARDKVLLDLEQECLEVYRRKVDSANMSRARLHQELAESEAELTHLLLSLGERSLPGRPEKISGTLKEQLDAITPALKEMRLRKQERVGQFRAVQGQIQKISAEIAGQSTYDDFETNIKVNENDLSLKKLEEHQVELQRLHNEKRDRLKQVEIHINKIRDLSAILGMESSMIITKVHPSLNDRCGISKNISDSILDKLRSTVEYLEGEKRNRLEKLQQLGKALKNLWNLMDTPDEDTRPFTHLTNLLSLLSTEVSNPGSLTLSMIQQGEAEVKRLDQLKARKMKELYFKKQDELERICRDSHMEISSQSEMENIINLINSGEIDHADLLASMEDQISRAKDESSSRKTIMEKVERWLMARNEECWLEEYNSDENRYTVRRGAHKNLKRAERARVLVNKIPDLVVSLIAKTKIWEEERQKEFLYDNVPLLAMLEEYNIIRREKDFEKIKHKEKKKWQSQVEPENPPSSRPVTSNQRIPNRNINGGLRRPSMSIQPMANIRTNSANEGRPPIEEKQGQKLIYPSGFGSHLQDEAASVVSTFSGPISP